MVSLTEIIMLLETVGTGVLAGVIAALLGWFKQGKWQKFNGVLFLQTLIIGAFIGAMAGGLGISLGEAEMYLATLGVLTGLVYVAENIAKTIWRRLKSYWESTQNPTT